MSRSEFARSGALFAGLLVSIWLVLYAVWVALPGIRPGHLQIYDAKQRAVSTGDVLPASALASAVIFGNSKVLSGFRPDLFDSLSGNRATSYNLGLPDSGRFIEELETLVEREQAPTHALLTKPWSEEDAKGLGDYLQSDAVIIRDLFPFHDLARDLVGFLFRARSSGGLRAHYDRSLGYVDQAIRDRGYFFIEDLSHFPEHRLPDDFTIESDSPRAEWTRDFDPHGLAFERLVALARDADLSILVVPTFHRENEFAPAGSNEATRAALAAHGIELLGPHYWRLPNRLFSDPLHLNRDGAEEYTRRLWELVGPSMVRDADARGSR